MVAPAGTRTLTFSVRFCWPPTTVSPSTSSTGRRSRLVTVRVGTSASSSSLISSASDDGAMSIGCAPGRYTGNSETPTRVIGRPTAARSNCSMAMCVSS